jgi:glutathione S-transferase
MFWLPADQWLLSSSDFESAYSFLDGYLAPQSFLVGYSLTIADIVVVVLEVCPCDALIHHVVLWLFRELINKLAKDEDKEKYARFVLRACWG